MALTKQQRMVKRLLVSDPDMDWKEATRKAGYSNPATAAARLKSNPAFMASISVTRHLRMAEEHIDKDLILGALWDLYEYSSEEGAVMMWDKETESYKQVGYREPDVRSAKDVLKLLADIKGYTTHNLKVDLNPGDKAFKFEKAIPASIQQVLDEEYGN